MRYLIRFQATVEAGVKLDQAGGPQQLFSYITERYRPECFYVNPSQRECYLVADIADVSDMTEMMLVVSRKCGKHPDFIPVATLNDFNKTAQNVFETAKKIP